MSSRAATAILLEASDKTRGAALLPAMRQAVQALHELVRSRFATDALHLIAFSYLAQEVLADQLAQLTWGGGQEWATGTNMQHALTVARELLGRDGADQREIIMLTAGIPTAHGAGENVELAYPPTQRTLGETFEAIAACAREQIALQFYILTRPDEARTFGGTARVRDPGRDQQSTAFADRVVASGHGQVVRLAATDLEAALLDHYQRRRSAPAAG